MATPDEDRYAGSGVLYTGLVTFGLASVPHSRTLGPLPDSPEVGRSNPIPKALGTCKGPGGVHVCPAGNGKDVRACSLDRLLTSGFGRRSEWT
jgi:hypothetical protein